MNIEDRLFGKTSKGEKVFAFTFSNANGLEATVINYGAVLQSVMIPGADGGKEELTLGFDTLEEYESDQSYMGATIGRVAGRISGGKFSLDGKEYILAKNDGENHLHGGPEGFSRKVWDAFPFIMKNKAGVKLFLESEDGDQGYPGRVTVNLTVTMDEDNNLIFEYSAEATAPTPVNITNHAYWNLNGNSGGKVLDHVLYASSSRYVRHGRGYIPTGEILPSENTPFDFTHPSAIGSAMPPEGYDNYLILDKNEEKNKPDIILSHPETGRKISITTDAPGFILYTGNFLNGRSCRRGMLSKHDGLCIETMEYPDAVNQANFPDIILKPGEKYFRRTAVNISAE